MQIVKGAMIRVSCNTRVYRSNSTPPVSQSPPYIQGTSTLSASLRGPITLSVGPTFKMFQAQRLAAEQQEMIARAYEQKPDQMFNRDFQVTVASNSNQMSPTLGLGNFDSSNYNIQSQQLDHHHHNQITQINNPVAHQEQQLQAELFLQPQIQPLQISQPRQSGSDDGGGPVGSSC